MLQEQKADEGVQADIPEPQHEDESMKIRPLERVKLYPKVPPEPHAYGKYSNFSRPWILQDGRGIPGQGSEMRDEYIEHGFPKPRVGIRKRMLTNFFWEQMLEEMVEELGSQEKVQEYCTEYDANFIKENFEPRNLYVSTDPTQHLLYPLYGTGSSPKTYYTEKIEKVGPHEILEKFRRCQEFTRPMEERLDDGWVL